MRTRIDGVTIGHWTDGEGLTGCTAVLLPPGTTASFEVRGGAPASRELIALEPEKSVTTVDAICLSGGSVFGLASADGVVAHLAELGRGVGTPAGSVPIVPTLALFDLAVGSPTARPGSEAGRSAAASALEEFETGHVGAGTGARAANWRGAGRGGGGLGYAEASLGEVRLGALVAVNAFGDILAPGAEGDLEAVSALSRSFDFDRSNTTIGAVFTNARLDKVGCRIVAQGAHDGLARAVNPPHTRYDGDAFVAAATGHVEAPVDLVRMLAVTAVAQAIRSTAPIVKGPATF